MRSCDQSLVTVAFLWEKLSQTQFYKDLTRKTAFFEEWFWFNFNNLGLALGTDLQFYTSQAKVLKLKVRKFWMLIPTFVEVTGEKLVGGVLAPPFWIGLKYLVHPSKCRAELVAREVSILWPVVLCTIVLMKGFSLRLFFPPQWESHSVPNLIFWIPVL